MRTSDSPDTDRRVILKHKVLQHNVKLRNTFRLFWTGAVRIEGRAESLVYGVKERLMASSDFTPYRNVGEVAA
jgi:hypothetical protein